MKRSLIFFLFFCLALSIEARIDTVYTTTDSTITIKFVETVETTSVLEKKFFKNTTGHNFTFKEAQTLLAGGKVTKSDQPICTSLFPPVFLKVFYTISLENGETKKIESNFKEPQKFSLMYGLFCMGLPLVIIFLVSFLISKKDKTLLILYICIGTPIIFIIFYHESMVSGLISSFVSLACLAVSLFFVMHGRIGSFLSAVNIICVCVGCFLLNNKTLLTQYALFIAGSIVISYLLRQWYFKRKETQKEMVQA